MAHAQRDRLDSRDRHEGVGDAGVRQAEAVPAQVVEVEPVLPGGAPALVRPGRHGVRGDDGGVVPHQPGEAQGRGALLRRDESGVEAVPGGEGLVRQVHLHPLAGRQELLLPPRLHGEPPATRVLLAAVVGPGGAHLHVLATEGHPHAVAGARVDRHPVPGHVQEVGVAPQAHADAAHLPPPGARRDDDRVLTVGVIHHKVGVPADPQGDGLLAEVGVAQHHGEAGTAMGQAHLPLHGDLGRRGQTDDPASLLERSRSRGAGDDALVPGAVAAFEAMWDPVDPQGEVAQPRPGGADPGAGELDAAAPVQVLDDGRSLPGGDGHPGALVLQDPPVGGSGAVPPQEDGGQQRPQDPGNRRRPERGRAAASEAPLTERSRPAELAVTTPAAIDGPSREAGGHLHGSFRHAHPRHFIAGRHRRAPGER